MLFFSTSEYTFEDLHPGRTYVILLKIQLTADRVIDTQSATVTTGKTIDTSRYMF